MGLAAVLAGVAGDAERARRYFQRSTDLPVMGAYGEAMRAGAHAVVLAFDGEAEQALIRFREGLRGVRQLGDVFDAGLLALAMLRVLGRDHAESRAAAEQAMPPLERTGARPLLAQLRAALGPQPDQAAGASSQPAAVPATP